MKIAYLLVLILAPAFIGSASPEGETFDLKVTRVRLLRNEAGSLLVDARGVTFRSSDGKTSIAIPMNNLREADVAGARDLRFQTYEVDARKPIERREYAFRAQTGAPVEELARFLAAHIRRPVVGRYPEDSKFQVAVYHRGAWSGSNGTLEIGDEAIQFVSERPADSRTWLYRDVETIGRPDPFRFRVTTIRETYVLELKDELPEGAYQLAWNGVYKLEGKSK